MCIGTSGRHRERVAVRSVLLGHELVVDAAHADTLLVVVQLREGDARRRVEDGEIDARLAQPIVVALRRRHGGEVLARCRDVPRVREDAPDAALLHREVFDPPAGTAAVEATEEPLFTTIADVVEEDREQLDDVPVTVEDREAELRPNPRRLRLLARIDRHVSLLSLAVPIRLAWTPLPDDSDVLPAHRPCRSAPIADSTTATPIRKAQLFV